ncbi:aminoacyl-tRNA hydrolase [Mycoplasmopsis ciconiae]|uniref:Peptidyl-tRNA hydrolase n=1 Tax=Mycoplasmopsis ciconiae TaxID=561067 RepID=A0ABU7ML49_9BACT|nr:aminoacyl-tRNA hydrolase [Mycoplasmopsis ciconiae]
MRLIVGLGNPGEQYKFTRHNVGFLVIDKITKKLNINLTKNKFNGEFEKVDDLIIAKPLTYMNKSGEFIQSLCNFYKISWDDVLVIHDEKDFNVGQASIKIGGSDAGHNGIKSVTQCLNNPNYKRIRIGIGKSNVVPLKDYVLQNFSTEEMKVLEPVLDLAAEAAISFAFNDINTVMNSFNQLRKK